MAVVIKWGVDLVRAGPFDDFEITDRALPDDFDKDLEHITAGIIKDNPRMDNRRADLVNILRGAARVYIHSRMLEAGMAYNSDLAKQMMAFAKEGEPDGWIFPAMTEAEQASERRARGAAKVTARLLVRRKRGRQFSIADRELIWAVALGATAGLPVSAPYHDNTGVIIETRFSHICEQLIRATDVGRSDAMPSPQTYRRVLGRDNFNLNVFFAS